MREAGRGPICLTLVDKLAQPRAAHDFCADLVAVSASCAPQMIDAFGKIRQLSGVGIVVVQLAGKVLQNVADARAECHATSVLRLLR